MMKTINCVCFSTIGGINKWLEMSEDIEQIINVESTNTQGTLRFRVWYYKKDTK